MCTRGHTPYFDPIVRLKLLKTKHLFRYGETRKTKVTHTCSRYGLGMSSEFAKCRIYNNMDEEGMASMAKYGSTHTYAKYGSIFAFSSP